MKTEQILPTIGAVTIGLFIGFILFAVILLPQYQKAISRAYWADEVINECIDQYPDFYDTIAEGDNWDNYTNNQ